MIFKIKKRVDDSNDSMPAIDSVSDTSEDDSESDSEDSEQVLWRESPKASRLLTYRASKLIPLITSPAWDEINASLNIHLTGPDSLLGLCDEARFARSHLKNTMSALLRGSKQARAALFCLKQMQSVDISKDLQIAFAKLLTHSLFHAEQLPELRTAIIKQLLTQPLIYQILPEETREAITEYIHSTIGSRTAVRTVPNVSSTPSDGIMKSSTQATSQKPFTTLNSSIAHRKDQSLSLTTTHPMVHQQQLRTNPLTKQNIKAWWNQFGFVQKNKKDTIASAPPLLSPLTELRLFQAQDLADHPVFGKPLKVSLRYASVRISAANVSGNLYGCGYIPLVVAKWSVLLPLPTLSYYSLVRCHNNSGLYLKENGSFLRLSMKWTPASSFRAATKVPGTFRVNGSSRRMRDLQAEFEKPPHVCTVSQHRFFHFSP